jgi:t-SNARE complex subunit (syntaxin)
MLDKRLTVVENKLNDVHKDVEKMDKTVDSIKLMIWAAAVGIICNLIGVIIIITIS